MILISVWNVVVEWKDAGILGLRRRGIQSRARDRAASLRALYNKVLLRYKGDRENFWHRHQKGAERVLPLLVFSWMLYSHQQSLNEKKECFKTQSGTRPPHPQDAFWDNLDIRWFIPGHKMINLNLVEGHITIQIVSLTKIREQISEYNILVCQLGSEALGRIDLRTEFWVKA